MGLFKRKRPPTPEELLAEGRREAAAASAGLVDGTAPAATGEFRMTVEDVFFITGRGVVATGRVASGRVSVGDEVRVWCDDKQVATVTVTGMESFRRTRAAAEAGENVGLLFKGVDRSGLASGDVLTS